VGRAASGTVGGAFDPKRTSHLGAVCAALAPAAARAQDATALVVMMAPPFLLAPLLAVVIRHRWLLHVGGVGRSMRTAVALASIEFVLWLLAAWCAAVVYFQGKWGAVLALGAIMVGIVALVRRLGVPHTSWLFSLALTSVFPAVWAIVQLLWYWCVLLW
jgi:hypothetical protein